MEFTEGTVRKRVLTYHITTLCKWLNAWSDKSFLWAQIPSGAWSRHNNPLVLNPSCSISHKISKSTAILSCRYGLHEKSRKIGLDRLDLKSRPSPHCWVRRNPRESTNFHFGPVEGGLPGQRTTTNAPSLHSNCNWLRQEGLKVRP